MNISQNVRPNEIKLHKELFKFHLCSGQLIVPPRKSSFTFQVAQVLQKHKVPFFPKEGTLHFCKIPQIYKVLYIREGRRDPSSALPGFLGPGRAENGFLKSFTL